MASTTGSVRIAIIHGKGSQYFINIPSNLSRGTNRKFFTVTCTGVTPWDRAFPRLILRHEHDAIQFVGTSPQFTGSVPFSSFPHSEISRLSGLQRLLGGR
jgi:hypothetical protein